MEDIRDFGMDLKEEIMNAVPDDIRNSLTLKETEVTKINDQKLYGLMFKRDGSEASPAIYVNQFFDRFRNGESIKTIAGEMVDLYLNSITDKEPKMPKALDFDDVKDHLTIRVIDIRKNREYLTGVPTTVTHGLMERQGYDKAALFEGAMQTAPYVDPPTFTSMGANLFGQGEQGNLLDNDDPLKEENKEPMYVLSNESGMFGAAALFYPGVQEKIAEKLGEGYYALPSSLHEYIIIPESAGIDAKEMCEMVKTANKTVVEPKDVLSDNVLHFDRNSKQLDSITDLLETSPKEAEMRC